MLWSRFLTQTLISAPFSDTIFDRINTRANYIPFCPCSFLYLVTYAEIHGGFGLCWIVFYFLLQFFFSSLTQSTPSF